MVNTMTNIGNKERTGFVSIHFPITVHHQRKSGQELRQGRAGAEAVEEAAAWLSPTACSACLFIAPGPAVQCKDVLLLHFACLRHLMG